VVPIANMITTSGYQAAFLWFGLGQGLVVCIVALLLKAPEAGEVEAPAPAAVQQTRRERDVEDSDLLRHVRDVRDGRCRWLMAIPQLAPIANDYTIAGVPVSIRG
jgi:OFA family oxalate/formate antiporter-like MFS transporter